MKILRIATDIILSQSLYEMTTLKRDEVLSFKLPVLTSQIPISSNRDTFLAD